MIKQRNGGLKQIFTLEPSREARRLAEKYGYKPWMIERYLQMLPYNEVIDLLEANEKPLPKAIRCNNFLINCETLKKRLLEKEVELEKIPFTKYGYYAKKGSGKIGYLHEYLLGYYYIQGPASMIPVDVLNPKAGEDILDAAAAPGGKATQILQYTHDKAFLTAIDKNRDRLKALRSHLSRMGFTNYIIIRMDALNVPSTLLYNKILLDAPCSGEGIIRRDPLRKKSRKISDLVYLSELQVSLLNHLKANVRINGTIVYSTCTIGVEENEYVLTKILENDPCLEPVDIKAPGVNGLVEYGGIKFDEGVKRCKRMFPHTLDTEGFFICKLRKKC
ncbi:MAG: RsmB/NOP family class I SAM-dependent RNA methyltransferase [Desulfurococcales archaeon]|nr:RsmB/NOP family class I SAM-dependent RNA methyltransferase [Desulfurococcales archaeon]